MKWCPATALHVFPRFHAGFATFCHRLAPLLLLWGTERGWGEKFAVVFVLAGLVAGQLIKFCTGEAFSQELLVRVAQRGDSVANGSVARL